MAFKTYLPDGDIDISVFENVSENDENQTPWYSKVKTAFKNVQNQNSFLVIRDVYFINAEVCVTECECMIAFQFIDRRLKSDD